MLVILDFTRDSSVENAAIIESDGEVEGGIGTEPELGGTEEKIEILSKR